MIGNDDWKRARSRVYERVNENRRTHDNPSKSMLLRVSVTTESGNLLDPRPM